MLDIVLGCLLLCLAAVITVFVIQGVRWVIAWLRALKFIRENGLTTGIYVKSTVNFNTRTGIYKSSAMPSKHAIEKFWI